MDDKGKIPVFLLKTKSIPNDGYEERLAGVKFNGLWRERVGGGERDSEGEKGLEPVFVPVLEHCFMDAGVEVVKGLLKEREIGKEEGRNYGGLIFTSQRAVELFAKLVEEGRQELDGMRA